MSEKRRNPIMFWKIVLIIPILSCFMCILPCYSQVEEQTKARKDTVTLDNNPSQVEELEDDIFIKVEQQPEYQGGMIELYKFLQKNMVYPEEARKMGVQGKVFIEFIVMVDGGITNIKVVRGIGIGCDEEAVRVLKISPKWIPGTLKGKPVNVKMIIPVVFKLS